MDPSKKALKNAWREKENKRLLDSIPMPIQDLKALFDYLDRPDAPACDHTLRDTTRFLSSRRLDVVRITPWLHEHGGYCDCEVLANVEGAFEDILRGVI